MIEYRKSSFDKWKEYDAIPMVLTVDQIIKVKKQGKGLPGMTYTFEDMPVKSYTVDFDDGEPTKRWTDMFDTRNWAMFMAYDGVNPVGGAVMAARTPEVRMLDGREDLAVLWDIRVKEEYRSKGIGQELFGMARKWCRENGYTLMKIECQNTNVAACRFYEKQGAELEVVNRHAYGTDEYMFLWYLTP